MVIHNVEARDHPITLNQCEAIIEEGFDSFFKIARALELIKKMKLYQSDYSCFEDYCEDKFKLPSKDADSFIKLMHSS